MQKVLKTFIFTPSFSLLTTILSHLSLNIQEPQAQIFSNSTVETRNKAYYNLLYSFNYSFISIRVKNTTDRTKMSLAGTEENFSSSAQNSSKISAPWTKTNFGQLGQNSPFFRLGLPTCPTLYFLSNYQCYLC